MTTIQLAAVLARIVRNSIAQTDAQGAPIECSRLNTFAVIYDQAEMQTENIGKTPDYKQKDYFFSRKWSLAGGNSNAIAWDFPALFIWEGAQTTDAPFDSQSQVTQNYTFALSDKMPVGDKQCKNCKYCEKRDIEQVVQDLRALANKLLATLSLFSYHELYLANVLVGQGWYTTAEVDAMVDAGDIDWSNTGEYFGSIASGIGGANTPIQAEIATAAYTADTATLFMNIQIESNQCFEPFQMEPTKAIKPIKNEGCCG
jgi:hypothetical protein